VDVEDILILISNALLDICEKKNININRNDIEKLIHFFDPKEETIIKEEDTTKSGGGGGEMSLNLYVLKLSLDAKSQIMGSSKKIETIRREIRNNFIEWNACIDNIIEKIREENNQKYPIIIFENFDKILPHTRAIDIFEKGYLEKIRMYIIYTFPIGLSYSEKFGTIEQYVSRHFFPMIDIRKQTGEKNQKGYDTIKKIIGKRVKSINLFEKEALNTLIEKTGGCLRDVFKIIVQASRYAERQNKNRVDVKDINRALKSEKSSITRRIEMKDYPDLNEIHRTKTEIKEKNKMLRFLEAHVILEYNGDRWHDLHPLVYDFLKENGRIIE
jgi:hypothetical protein